MNADASRVACSAIRWTTTAKIADDIAPDELALALLTSLLRVRDELVPRL